MTYLPYFATRSRSSMDFVKMDGISSARASGKPSFEDTNLSGTQVQNYENF
jgi:hypothetical protein